MQAKFPRQPQICLHYDNFATTKNISILPSQSNHPTQWPERKLNAAAFILVTTVLFPSNRQSEQDDQRWTMKDLSMSTCIASCKTRCFDNVVRNQNVSLRSEDKNILPSSSLFHLWCLHSLQILSCARMNWTWPWSFPGHCRTSAQLNYADDCATNSLHCNKKKKVTYSIIAIPKWHLINSSELGYDTPWSAFAIHNERPLSQTSPWAVILSQTEQALLQNTKPHLWRVRRIPMCCDILVCTNRLYSTFIFRFLFAL